MDLGSVAPVTGAEWIGQPQHEELQRGARPQLPADDPFYDPPAGFQHANPGTVLRSRDVELANELRTVPPSKVTFTTVPVADLNYTTPTGQSAVLWDSTAAVGQQSTLRRFAF